MVVINVWDKGMIGKVEKAIRESGLGINPVTDGHDPPADPRAERAAPPQAAESPPSQRPHRDLRNVRRDGMDQIKKAKAADRRDDQKIYADEVQEMTDSPIGDWTRRLKPSARSMQV